MVQVDLNCDLGESFGNYKVGNDELILPLITSANVACGFHAGDQHVMNETVKTAAKYNIHIGAHPGFQDLNGFGRRNMDLTPQEVYDLVIYQLGALSGFCKIHNTKIYHVKPHGALYQMGAKVPEIADAIVKAVKDFDDQLLFVGLSNSELIESCKRHNLTYKSEVFADRAYEDNGQLVSRKKEGALIKDTDQAVAQVIKMVKESKVKTINGKEISIEADTICVHGDGQHALDFVKEIIAQFESEGIQISAMK
ncbi:MULTISPECIES: 5-oxoprolinase subunit PxpA [Mammaliicoccus]|uniref:5-oxoprolinase subunit PxpA n=1 Tax=Mammaliicoccus TaxID=2803850 RepID=UPI000D1E00D6|nr:MULTISPECIES: 5-oxoprolinase subunit PxpA [Mammaliicoccus]PTI37640.1 LamB/YcsF family protein [Mammaliicoccus vitulinus]PTI72346.1 LamB/YcsF family protein [Mammaliicoccus vitulinus]RIN24187.1 5-oxoprolinase subunit PxpA [Mammaliicoccus vitulinus]